jgi:hypothetical protein
MLFTLSSIFEYFANLNDAELSPASHKDWNYENIALFYRELILVVLAVSLTPSLLMQLFEAISLHFESFSYLAIETFLVYGFSFCFYFASPIEAGSFCWEESFQFVANLQ